MTLRVYRRAARLPRLGPLAPFFVLLALAAFAPIAVDLVVVPAIIIARLAATSCAALARAASPVRLRLRTGALARRGHALPVTWVKKGKRKCLHGGGSRKRFETI